MRCMPNLCPRGWENSAKQKRIIMRTVESHGIKEQTWARAKGAREVRRATTVRDIMTVGGKGRG